MCHTNTAKEQFIFTSPTMAPPATDNTLLSPKELDNGKGGFAFAHEDMISLMRYVWEGCFLPQTPDSYATTFGFQISDLSKEVSAELDSIIGSYGEVCALLVVYFYMTG